METTYQTKFGEVQLRVAMIDINGTDLCEGVEVKLDDELIGEVFNVQIDYIDEMSVEEVEEIVESII
jgi:hypothetical protein